MQRASRSADRLSRLVADIYGRNPFYTRKLDAAGIGPGQVTSLSDLSKLPLTTKAELIADQQTTPPWGTNLTEPIERYTRYSQTSSTTGSPLRWLDTNESWQWMLECWKAVYGAASVDARDRIFFPFSFGPFLGFWTAFEAGCQLGAHCIPAGGMSSQARLSLIDTLKPTVICCTPTYALRLMEVASESAGARIDLSSSSVRALIVAGEPGGSIASTRERIEKGWGARVIDHYGLTEVGPIAFECWESPGGLHLNEDEYVCEVLEPGTQRETPDGERGELVITNLGRSASPLLRYRTGDVVVKLTRACECGRTLARLEGGILARVDDMVNVRGVNVYPSAVEAVVRRFAEIAEFRATVSSNGSLRELSIEVEVTSGGDAVAPVVARLRDDLRESLGLTVPVKAVDAGFLPRFEMKARRFIIED
ncbi:MAG TPA: AMP-binding protein [Vicinamibacterales bacterium]|nr:AMP-binding protein [Vicinamibacterales bacterium]